MLDQLKTLMEKIKSRAQKMPLNSPDIVKLSQEADIHIIRAMKKINNL